MIEFFVPGIPKPGGSKRAFYNKKLKRAMVVDACAKTKDWKASVQAFAITAFQGSLFRGPVSLSVEFRMPRPKAHYRTGKHAGELRDDAPYWHTTRPDRTKLLRSTEDALKGVLWGDDCQVCAGEVFKVYSETPGALIRVTELPSAARRAK